jgi:hypothetical protein
MRSGKPYPGATPYASREVAERRGFKPWVPSQAHRSSHSAFSTNGVLRAGIQDFPAAGIHAGFQGDILLRPPAGPGPRAGLDPSPNACCPVLPGAVVEPGARVQEIGMKDQYADLAREYDWL